VGAWEPMPEETHRSGDGSGGSGSHGGGVPGVALLRGTRSGAMEDSVGHDSMVSVALLQRPLPRP